MTFRRWMTVGLLATSLTLAGCGQPEPDLSHEAATELQTAVLAVAEAASQGRYDAAAAAAVEVRSALDAAAMTSSLSLQRYRTIDSALRATEAELAALLAAEAQAEAAEAEAAEAEAAETEEAAAAVQEGSGKKDNGKGRDSDDSDDDDD